jgi:hypothetical protein
MPVPPSPATYNVLPNSPTQTSEEDSVACPYQCGTTLTGVHAVGNLTRHLKSDACLASGREKLKYPCHVYGPFAEATWSSGSSYADRLAGCERHEVWSVVDNPLPPNPIVSRSAAHDAVAVLNNGGNLKMSPYLVIDRA